jgi:hypothetical protein
LFQAAFKVVRFSGASFRKKPDKDVAALLGLTALVPYGFADGPLYSVPANRSSAFPRNKNRKPVAFQAVFKMINPETIAFPAAALFYQQRYFPGPFYFYGFSEPVGPLSFQGGLSRFGCYPETVRRFLPFFLRWERTFRPFLVAILFLKPWAFFLFLFEG